MSFILDTTFSASAGQMLLTVGWFIVQVILALLAFLIALYVWIQPKHVDASVPGPKRHPFFGVTFTDASDFLDGKAFDWALWPTLSLCMSRKFGFQTWGGPLLNVGFGGAFFNVVSPACLTHILNTAFDNFEKGKLTKCFAELMGQVAFTTDGALWKFHRKNVVGVLNRHTVAQGAVVLEDKLKQLDAVLREKEGQTVDFQGLSYRLILDVFVKLGFGVDLNSVETDQHVPFVEAFDELQLLIHVSGLTVGCTMPVFIGFVFGIVVSVPCCQSVVSATVTVTAPESCWSHYPLVLLLSPFLSLSLSLPCAAVHFVLSFIHRSASMIHCGNSTKDSALAKESDESAK